MKSRPGKRLNLEHFNQLYGDGYEVVIHQTEYTDKYYLFIRENCRKGDWTYYRREKNSKYSKIASNISRVEWEDVYLFADSTDAVAFKMMS